MIGIGAVLTDRSPPTPHSVRVLHRSVRQVEVAPSLRIYDSPNGLHHVPYSVRPRVGFWCLTPAFECRSLTAFILVQPFAPCRQRLRTLLTRSGSISHPFGHKARSPHVRTRSVTAQPPNLRQSSLSRGPGAVANPKPSKNGPGEFPHSPLVPFHRPGVTRTRRSRLEGDGNPEGCLRRLYLLLDGPVDSGAFHRYMGHSQGFEPVPQHQKIRRRCSECLDLLPHLPTFFG